MNEEKIRLSLVLGSEYRKMLIEASESGTMNSATMVALRLIIVESGKAMCGFTAGTIRLGVPVEQCGQG